MFKIALLLCLVTFSISSQVNISFIIKQAKFLRELEEESFDYPIKSFSYLTSCGIKTSDFALSITYPVNYTLDDLHNPTATFKLKNEDIKQINDSLKNTNIILKYCCDCLDILKQKMEISNDEWPEIPNEII